MLNLEDYAKNHPGGSIGRRIFLKVEDVMIKGNRLPFIGPDTDFKGCVVEMTRHALGVLIVNSPCTPGGFGIISEKDLRVGMEKFGPLVFEVTAKDLMNPNPIVVESHILALEALEFMRSRGKPLLFLPVVHPKETSANSAQECIGLLRVHELVSQGIAMT
jgi:arabinose-5-phosphate isomerase